MRYTNRLLLDANIMKFAVKLVALVLLAFAYGSKVNGQSSTDYSLQTGNPNFAARDSFPGGFVNLSNGDLHFEIPLGAFPQRGKLSSAIQLGYDSRIWQVVNNGTSKKWAPYLSAVGLPASSVQNGGWYISPGDGTGVLTASGSVQLCTGGFSYTTLGPFVWTDANNTPHVFPVMVRSNECSTGISQADAFSLDGSGAHLFATITSEGFIFHIFDRDGKNRYFRYVEGSGTGIEAWSEGGAHPPYIHDSNGNYIESQTFSVQLGGMRGADTLGRTNFVYNTGEAGSLSYIKVGNSNSTQFSSSGGIGGSATTYYQNWADISGTTGFGVTGVTETSWTFTVLQGLSLPGGASYSFTYDCDSSSGNPACGSPSGHSGYTGALVQLTLPMGGAVKFTYRNFTDANGNTNQWVASRQQGSGTWSYSQLASCGSGCQTVTMLDPEGNTTVYIYSISNSNLARTSRVDRYSGAASGSPLLSVQNSYTSYSTDPSLGSIAYVLPSSSTKTLSSAGGNLVSKRTYTFDSLTYTYQGLSHTGSAGKLLTQTDYAYGNGVPASQPTRTITYAYRDDTNQSGTNHTNGSNYKNANLVDLISDITLRDSGGSKIAETSFAYDENYTTKPTVAGVSNAVGCVIYCGNITSIARWIATTNYSTIGMTYDSTGQAIGVTDANGQSTTLSYASTGSFDDPGDGPSNPPVANSYPTQNAYVTAITPPLLPPMTIGYYYGSGKQARITDANGRANYFHYFDSANRPTSVILADGGWNYLSYGSNGTQFDNFGGIDQSFSTSSCTSCLHTQSTYDAFGRTQAESLPSDPDGSATRVITYDSIGNLQTVSSAYRSTSDPTYGVSSYTYDALSRPKTIAHPDGNTISVFYGADVSSAGGISNELCPSGTYGLGYPELVKDEAGRPRQLWIDAFGHLIEVDEPNSSGALSVPTCYRYSAKGDLIEVDQGNRARTFSYDGLSRLLSTNTPESGLTTYTYDANSNVLTRTSPAPNQTGSARVTVTFTYDALNRVVQKSYSDGITPTIKYGYDGATLTGCTTTPPTLVDNNPKGNRTAMCDGAGAESWSHDSMGRVLSDSRITNALAATYSDTYNLDGSIKTVAYGAPGGSTTETITYSQGGAGRPLSATSSLFPNNYVIAAHYAPNGALCGQSYYGNNAALNVSYNNRFQPQHWHVTSTPWGGNPAPPPCQPPTWTAGWIDLTYNYVDSSGHNNGNVIGIFSKAGNSAWSPNFTYDSLNRIATAQTNGTISSGATNCWAETYTIDAWGNLLSNAPNPTTQSAYNGCIQEAPSNLAGIVQPSNRLSGTGFTTDAAGNLISDGVHTFTFVRRKPSSLYCANRADHRHLQV